MKERLSGTVTVHEGQPARLATVELCNAEGDIVDQVAVDDSGRFIYHLSAGQWSLRAWDPFGHRVTTDIVLDAGESKNIALELGEPEGGH